LIYVLIPIQII